MGSDPSLDVPSVGSMPRVLHADTARLRHHSRAGRGRGRLVARIGGVASCLQVRAQARLSGRLTVLRCGRRNWWLVLVGPGSDRGHGLLMGLWLFGLGDVAGG